VLRAACTSQESRLHGRRSIDHSPRHRPIFVVELEITRVLSADLNVWHEPKHFWCDLLAFAIENDYYDHNCQLGEGGL